MRHNIGHSSVNIHGYDIHIKFEVSLHFDQAGLLCAMWITEVIQYPASRMSIKLLLELFEFEKGQKGSKQTMISTYFST